ncbi:hypothetical protein LHT11_15120 [Acetobacter indonesiensis]|uniref:hypothetical protein n=1 Tax=Acetobacter indonesiensis TaxID=104101 RepID=UPI001F368B43|nr:hypothetical protein [Acetobacter indonesiensis]MCG0996499.1 hypothetical protein [Acetobacter indonesiensis]
MDQNIKIIEDIINNWEVSKSKYYPKTECGREEAAIIYNIILKYVDKVFSGDNQFLEETCISEWLFKASELSSVRPLNVYDFLYFCKEIFKQQNCCNTSNYLKNNMLKFGYNPNYPT